MSHKLLEVQTWGRLFRTEQCYNSLLVVNDMRDRRSEDLPRHQGQVTMGLPVAKSPSLGQKFPRSQMCVTVIMSVPENATVLGALCEESTKMQPFSCSLASPQWFRPVYKVRVITPIQSL